MDQGRGSIGRDAGPSGCFLWETQCADRSRCGRKQAGNGCLVGLGGGVFAKVDRTPKGRSLSTSACAHWAQARPRRDGLRNARTGYEKTSMQGYDPFENNTYP